MAPKISLAPRAPLSAIIEEPLFINDRAYIPEPPMEDGRRNVGYGYPLIPYSISDTIFAFMGTFPIHIKKYHVLRHFFPSYPSYEPLVFMDEPFDFSLFKNKVSCSSSPTKDDSYIKWLDMVQ